MFFYFRIKKFLGIPIIESISHKFTKANLAGKQKQGMKSNFKGQNINHAFFVYDRELEGGYSERYRRNSKIFSKANLYIVKKHTCAR